MRKVLSLLTMLMLTCTLAMAQQRDVSGRVVDGSGDGVPFASIKVKGSSTGVTSDAEGKFALRVKSSDELIITATGFQTKQLSVGNSATLSISLDKDVKSQETIVVIGTAFGIKKSQRNQISSAQVITGEQINTTRQPNLVSALAGKVVGTQVRGQSGAKLNAQADLRVRGGSSLGFDRPAIYVVDGTIVNSFDINPDDIETSTVLKGANATVLFGDRAANGAVVITTKGRGKKNDFGVDVSQSVTFDQISILPRYQDKYAGGDGGFRTFKYVAGMPASWQPLDGKKYHDFTDDASWGPRIDGSEYIPWYALIPGTKYSGKTASLTAQPNNVRNFFEKGITSNFNVQTSKTTENSFIRLSYTNQDIKGILPTTSSKRHTIGFKTDYDISKYVSVGINYNLTTQKIVGEFADGYSNQSTGNFGSWFHRDLDTKILKELNGTLTPAGTLASWNFRVNPNAYNPANPRGFFGANFWYNTYDYFNNISNAQERQRSYGDIHIEIKPITGLVLRGTVRRNQLTTYLENLTRSKLQFSGLQTSLLADYTTQSTNFQEQNYEFFANYRKTVKDFGFDLLGGANELDQKTQNSFASTENGLKTDDLYAVSNSAANPTVTNTRQRVKNRSVFSQLDINYKKFLNISGSIRSDWYSVLQAGNNNLVSKSFGAGFIFSDVLKDQAPWLSYGKLYGSYGEKPLAPLSFAQNSLAYTLNQNSFGVNPLQTTPNTNVDPGIEGILVSTKEYGLDLKFFKNRFGLNIVYYDEFIDKEPATVSVSGASGFTGQLKNVGQITRKGIEIESFYKIFQKKNFKWDVNFNIAKLLENKVLDVDGNSGTNDQRVLLQGGAFGARFARAFQVEGKNANQLIGGGIKRNENGVPILNIGAGTPNDGTFQTDVNKEWGSTVPTVTGGLMNNFKYKNFNLAVNIDYQFGGQFFSLSEMWGSFSGLLEWTAGTNNRGKEIRDDVNQGGGVHVVGVATDGKTPVDMYVPAQEYFHQFYNNQIAEPFIHSLSFVKLREISLGYDFNVKGWGIKWLKGANFSVISRNPLLIYKKSQNFDPSEISNLYGEDGQLPPTRSMGVNLRVSF
jgi:TonB-linked SusC/RagA family outer membrane protein